MTHANDGSRSGDAPLTIAVSAALKAKLAHVAQDEGVDLATLVAELLAEGVTLRAWEIVERKGAMRGQASGARDATPGGNRPPFRGPGHQGGGNSHANGPRGGYGQGGSGPRGGGKPRPNHGGNHAGNWMEDKAAFLEYVRNQEKRGR
jgi:hypothetical protein